MFPFLFSSLFIVVIDVGDGGSSSSSIANQLLLLLYDILLEFLLVIDVNVNVRVMCCDVMCCDFIRLMYTLHVYIMSRVSQIKTYLVECGQKQGKF